jgi:phosphatidate cytidylyltransferase
MITLSANLKQRIISAVILAPVILCIIYSGGILFSSLIILLAILMSFEWTGIISHAEDKGHHNLWLVIGVFYIAIPCISLLWLRGHSSGLIITLWVLLSVWATDIAAYFAGRFFGGWKLAPSISPNKTWSGLAGGVLASSITGMFVLIFIDSQHPVLFVLLSGLLAVIAQIGDLFESGIKRHFGVKDSGTILPGHGGILDRVDGILTAAPAVALIMLIDGGNLV